MIERKLSKTQIRVFAALAQQRAELQAAFQEVVEAEKEQIETLRRHFGLPDGEYRLRQDPSGDVALYAVATPVKEEPPAQEEPSEEPPTQEAEAGDADAPVEVEQAGTVEAKPARRRRK